MVKLTEKVTFQGDILYKDDTPLHCLPRQKSFWETESNLKQTCTNLWRKQTEIIESTSLKNYILEKVNVACLKS